MSLSALNRNRLALGLVVAVTFVIVGGLVWGFGQQLALARQMRAEEARLEQIVADERARHDDLIAKLAYIKSDEYVEHWARAEGKMARPGEVAVVVAVDWDEEPAIETTPAPAPESEGRPFWVEWWELIFGG